MKKVFRWFRKLVVEDCPNCMSAAVIGAVLPKECIICNDRGWVLRWAWLHTILITDRNIVRLKK